jgi:CubicO group peptidase (beta-lactamase class C family)
VVLVCRDGQPVYERAVGLADRESGRAMREDAIFRLASVTKPIVAAAALRMADLGLIGLDDAVTEYLPYFAPASPDGVVRPILIRHLLTHTSGLTYNVGPDISTGLSGPLITLEENLRRLAARPLAFVPGGRWEYGMSIDVLGGVIAAVNRSDPAAAVARYVTGPLGMTDTMFGVADDARLAVPYADGRPPRRMGEPEVYAEEDGSSTVFSPARILQADARR